MLRGCRARGRPKMRLPPLKCKTRLGESERKDTARNLFKPFPKLYSQRNDTGAWDCISSDLEKDGGHPTLGIDASENLHIVARTWSHDLIYGVCSGDCCTSNSWDWKKPTDPFTTSVTAPLSLALSDNSKASILYSKDTGDAVVYVDCDGVDHVIGEGYVCSQRALALDSGANPHLVFRSKDGHSLNYAYWDGTDWISDVIFRSAGDISGCQIELYDDMAHIAFVTDNGQGRALYYIPEPASMVLLGVGAFLFVRKRRG